MSCAHSNDAFSAAAADLLSAVIEGSRDCASRHQPELELSSGCSLTSCCRPLMRWAALRELRGGATGRFHLVHHMPVGRCWGLVAAVCIGLVSNLSVSPWLRAFTMVGAGAEATAGPQDTVVRAHARRPRRGVDLDEPGALSSAAVVRSARLHRPFRLCGVDWSAP